LVKKGARAVPGKKKVVELISDIIEEKGKRGSCCTRKREGEVGGKRRIEAGFAMGRAFWSLKLNDGKEKQERCNRDEKAQEKEVRT